MAGVIWWSPWKVASNPKCRAGFQEMEEDSPNLYPPTKALKEMATVMSMKKTLPWHS